MLCFGIPDRHIFRQNRNKYDIKMQNESAPMILITYQNIIHEHRKLGGMRRLATANVSFKTSTFPQMTPRGRVHNAAGIIITDQMKDSSCQKQQIIRLKFKCDSQNFDSLLYQIHCRSFFDRDR